MTVVSAAFETQRLNALADLDILDTPEEHEYDELVRLASQICATPISLVSLVDHERQWFKAAVGLEAKETPRDVSFCSHAIQKPGLFVIENAVDDDRFRDNGLVTGDPNIRFYAGMPILSPSGFAVGTLCVIDTVPRKLTESQKTALIILGQQVKGRMELRVKQRDLEQAAAANARLTEELRNQNSLFHTFMNNSPFMGFIKDADGRFVYYNQRFTKTFELAPDQWMGKTDSELFPSELAEEYRRNDLKVLQSDTTVEFFEDTLNKEEDRVHWKSFKFPLKLDDGRRMLAGISVDLTADLNQKAALEQTLREKAQKEQQLSEANALLERLATTDSLTGLANRRIFEVRMEVEFTAVERSQRRLTVLAMDVDNFKRRNDTYGHAAGDEALRLIGRILLESVRAGDMAARMGGEEFAILLPDTSVDGAAELAQRIRRRLAEAECCGDPLTISIGIAAATAVTLDREELMSQADDAMYDAKRSGKDRFVVHENPVMAIEHLFPQVALKP
jgi:diguanylate cyclase (GGDEF)-like protein/PAS domain S-box-containing protein